LNAQIDIAHAQAANTAHCPVVSPEPDRTVKDFLCRSQDLPCRGEREEHAARGIGRGKLLEYII
jgi:hypothetical protein